MTIEKCRDILLNGPDHEKPYIWLNKNGHWEVRVSDHQLMCTIALFDESDDSMQKELAEAIAFAGTAIKMLLAKESGETHE